MTIHPIRTVIKVPLYGLMVTRAGSCTDLLAMWIAAPFKTTLQTINRSAKMWVAPAAYQAARHFPFLWHVGVWRRTSSYLSALYPAILPQPSPPERSFPQPVTRCGEVGYAPVGVISVTTVQRDCDVRVMVVRYPASVPPKS